MEITHTAGRLLSWPGDVYWQKEFLYQYVRGVLHNHENGLHTQVPYLPECPIFPCYLQLIHQLRTVSEQSLRMCDTHVLGIKSSFGVLYENGAKGAQGFME